MKGLNAAERDVLKALRTDIGPDSDDDLDPDRWALDAKEHFP